MKDNIKICIKERDERAWIGYVWLRINTNTGVLQNYNAPSGFIKFRVFLVQHSKEASQEGLGSMGSVSVKSS